MYWIEMPSGAGRSRLRHAGKRVLIGMVDGAIEIVSSSTATTVKRVHFAKIVRIVGRTTSSASAPTVRATPAVGASPAEIGRHDDVCLGEGDAVQRDVSMLPSGEDDR
jgi:hypothetical protein